MEATFWEYAPAVEQTDTQSGVFRSHRQPGSGQFICRAYFLMMPIFVIWKVLAFLALTLLTSVTARYFYLFDLLLWRADQTI
jgi:hypothetical protein